MEVDVDKIVKAYSYEGATYGLLELDNGDGLMVVPRDDSWEPAKDAALIVSEAASMSMPVFKLMVKPSDSARST